MPDLSEFIAFVAGKSGVSKGNLIERDILLHRILKEVCSYPHFTESYLFKGGSCLVKCYLGYYRFSVDLDFTWRNQKAWGGRREGAQEDTPCRDQRSWPVVGRNSQKGRSGIRKQTKEWEVL